MAAPFLYSGAKHEGCCWARREPRLRKQTGAFLGMSSHPLAFGMGPILGPSVWILIPLTASGCGADTAYGTKHV